MSNRFNPYQAWFGLDTTVKPSYYALLGLRDFETEPPVIAEAAECRLQQLEPHKKGEHAELADKLGREVTGVMNVLLSPEKRRQYDEKLRNPNGASPAAAKKPAPSADAMLPPALAAADSPTEMLPPGALPPLPPLGAAPPMPPMGHVPYAPTPQPGYIDGGFPQPHGMPMAAPPGMGGFPQAPLMAPGMPPQAAPFGGPPGYPPQAAPGFGQPVGGPPFGQTDASPFGAAAMAAAPGVPPAANAPFTSSNVSQRTRLAGARRQKSSPVMLALGLLGAGAAVLAIVMLVVAAMNKRPAPVAQTPAKTPAVVKPNAVTSETLMAQQAEDARRRAQEQYAANTANPGGNSVTERLSGGPSFTSPTAMNPGMSSNLPSNDQLVMSMAPAGAVPSIATPRPVTPSFDTPTPSPTTPPPTAMPLATASTTPSTPPTTMTPPAAPVIAGTDPSKMEMEAVLPPDDARARSVTTMLGAARRSLKSRDYGKAEEIILQAQVLADAPDVIRSAQAHARLLEYLQTFWTAAKEGVKSLKEGEEIQFNGNAMTVVKHDDLNLVIKGADNREIVLVIDKLLPGLAVQMAERTLSPDDATTKIATAALLGVDQAGDAAKAAALLDEAAGMGSDVEALKAVLTAGP